MAEDEEDAAMYKLLEALTPTPYGWSKNTSHCNWKGVTCDTYNSVDCHSPEYCPQISTTSPISSNSTSLKTISRGRCLSSPTSTTSKKSTCPSTNSLASITLPSKIYSPKQQLQPRGMDLL
ncbi:putative receptor protein kinase [Arachis hypogaea]|nr:putative receptor protein kinase [Arachis hypogaea]